MATAMVTDARDDASEAHRARTISKTRADPKFSALAHALGEEGMCTLRCARVIVVGAGLVGSETARLLTLCGVREIVLVDDADHAVTADDVAANIILRHRDVGERRVHAVAEALTSERNKVAGDVSITPISDPARAAFHRADAIIFSRDADPSTPSDPRLVDALASADDAPVVDARSAGLAAFAVAYPRRARTRDARTVRALPAMLESLTRDGDALVATVCDAAAHGLSPGDRVVFSDVVGFDGLNDAAPQIVSETSGPYAFKVTLDEALATRLAGMFVRGGYVHQRERIVVEDDARRRRTDEKDPRGSGFASRRTDETSFREFPVGSEDTFLAPALPANLPVRVREHFEAHANVRVPAACAVAAAWAANEAVKLITGCHAFRRASGVAYLDEALEDAAVRLRDVIHRDVTSADVTIADVTSADVTSADVASADVASADDAVADVRRDVTRSSSEKDPRRALSDAVVAEVHNLRLALAGAGGVGRETMRLWAAAGAGGFDAPPDARREGRVDVVDGALLHEHDLGRGLLVDAASAGSFVSRAAVESLRGYAAARRDAARRDAASGDFENPLPGWTARAAWLGRGDVVSLSSTSSLSSVGFQETVGRLPDAFLDEVDAVCVAVDSLGDRRAADELSLRRRFALVDAGVDGDRLSVHVAVPDVTVPWSEGPRDSPDWDPPSCVLGNFPHAFQHAARWARDVFGDYFESSPRKTNAYLRDPTFAAETLRSRTRNVHARLADARDVHAALVAERPRDLHACVRWARARFDDAFVRAPREMLSSFPEDHRAACGAPFWTGTKRVPTPLAFDANDPAHLGFVCFGANLRAATYGLKGRSDQRFRDECREALAEDVASRETCEARDRGDDGTADEAARAVAAEAEFEALASELPSRESLAGYRLVETTFLPRDPDHSGFVAAAAACRAAVYRIPTPSDPIELEAVAANARPGLPTTALFAAALVAVETYKLAANRVAKDAAVAGSIPDADASESTRPFAHTYAALGANVYATARPTPVTRRVSVTAPGKPDLAWTAWDVVDVDCRGGVTLDGFVRAFEERVGLEVAMVSYGASLLYADFMNREKIAARLATPLVDVVADVGKAEPLPPTTTHVLLSVGACDERGEDVDVPDVRARVR